MTSLRKMMLEEPLPRQARAFLEGPEQCSVGLRKLSGGTEKADRAKLPGVGILPKPSPGK